MFGSFGFLFTFEGASLIDENFDSVSMASGGGGEEESMGSFTFKITGPDGGNLFPFLLLCFQMCQCQHRLFFVIGTVHRFSSKNADLKALKEAVTKKCGPIPSEGLKYLDEENDLVSRPDFGIVFLILATFFFC